MNFKNYQLAFCSLCMFMLLLPTIGCRSSKEQTRETLQPEPSSTAKKEPTEEEHGHVDGQHGGIMVSLGRDSYHVEAVIDAEGCIRLYTLGKDETRVIDVESQTLQGFIKVEGSQEAQALAFEPQPQQGDSEHRTSLFVAKLPKDWIGKPLEVTIPNIRIDGERFRLSFQSRNELHDREQGMPSKVAGSEEQKLYLTPGVDIPGPTSRPTGTQLRLRSFEGSHRRTT